MYVADDREILDVVYETNPLDETCDQRVRVETQPLLVAYDARTMDNVIAMFQSNEVSHLSQLQAAARETLNDLKKTSTMGLEYAIKNHTIMDVDIRIKGPYLILSHGGYMEDNRGSFPTFLFFVPCSRCRLWSDWN